MRWRIPVFLVLVGGGSLYFSLAASQEISTSSTDVTKLKIAERKIMGHTDIHKFGINPDIDTGTDPEDVWDHDSVYVFPSSAVTHYISSSDNGDTLIDIEIQGLDGSFVEQMDTVTLVGQTRTEITGTTWLRVHRARNISGTVFSGTVYIFEDSGVSSGVPAINANISAVLLPTHQQTMMAIYTIPAGKTGYISKWYVSAARISPANMIAEVLFQVRENGGVFTTQDQLDVFGTGTSTVQLEYGIPRPYPAKTDIRIRIQEVSASNSSISSAFHVILVED